MFVCVVDDRAGAVDLSDEGVEVIRLDELSLEPAVLRAMALYYNVTEFSTALKPWVLEAALAQSSRPVLYLDPDIEVFGRLDALARTPRSTRSC
jgi:hypothetical protein